jgi:transposase
LTACGVKPICPFQQVFRFTYLFGAYSPFSGDHFELELPSCNSAAFQVYLQEFSEYKPEEFKIILLDNGAFHKAKCLTIPHNITLLFIPPYSPELNPAEKIWWRIKRHFTGKSFPELDALSEFISIEVKNLSPQVVKSICSFDYLFSCSYWTNIY